MSPFVAAKIDDYHNRIIRFRTKKIKDVVDLLEILILPGPDNGTSLPKIFEGGVEINAVISALILFYKSLNFCLSFKNLYKKNNSHPFIFVTYSTGPSSVQAEICDAVHFGARQHCR